MSCARRHMRKWQRGTFRPSFCFSNFYLFSRKHNTQRSRDKLHSHRRRDISSRVKRQTPAWLGSAVKVTPHHGNDTMFYSLYPLNLILSQAPSGNTRRFFPHPCYIADKVSLNRPEFPPRAFRLAVGDERKKTKKKNNLAAPASRVQELSCRPLAVGLWKHRDVPDRAIT